MSDDYCLHCRAMVSECKCPDEEAPRFVSLAAVNAAKAEAVLAFARWMDGRDPKQMVTLQAKAFCSAEGWSETPGQAERGKP